MLQVSVFISFSSFQFSIIFSFSNDLSANFVPIFVSIIALVLYSFIMACEFFMFRLLVARKAKVKKKGIEKKSNQN